jgi:mannose-6-phosphate isomerase
MGELPYSDKPQAELWMGTHRQGISQIKYLKDTIVEWIPLDQLIKKDPIHMLGPVVAKRFDNQLPFLFKILAISNPLSIQVHPNKQQAMDGFETENKKGISLTESFRNYKDNQDKPELICALTPLWAMCGFRDVESIYTHFQCIVNKSLQNLFTDKCIQSFFTRLMHLKENEKKILIDAAVQYSEKEKDLIQWQWVQRLSRKFPYDIGVLSPLFLNIVCLKPLEALFIQPGVLHAYLDGNAIEIMNNSDNVIRGGLTIKHMDINSLLDIVVFKSEKIHYINPQKNSDNEIYYQSPSDSFVLSRYDVLPDHSIHVKVHGPEIILCTKGECLIKEKKEKLFLKQGMSAFVAHLADQYTIEGQGEIFKAGCRNF